MLKSKIIEENSLRQIAGFMCTAARTAPKAKGIDNIAAIIIENEKDKNRLIKRMIAIAQANDKPGFARDAENLKESHVIVIIGTKTGHIGLTYCGICGYTDCDALLKAKAQCAFNSLDLGIALGSAVNIAAQFHADNRIMYSVGIAAIELNLFNDKKIKFALGIPLSASRKNIFFDRK